VALTHIEHQLQATPNDPHLQQLEARSEILEEKYDPAIDILERLVAKDPLQPACCSTMLQPTSNAASLPTAKATAPRP